MMQIQRRIKNRIKKELPNKFSGQVPVLHKLRPTSDEKSNK